MNSRENISQESNDNKWADVMAGVKPFGCDAESERTRQIKTEQEKDEKELIASIKRGYFEKTPAVLRRYTREFLETTPYAEEVRSLNPTLEAYGPEMEATGVSISDLLLLSNVYYNETHYRHGDRFEIPMKSVGRVEFCKEGLDDAYDRYFSELAPIDRKQHMSSILKKMHFFKDLVGEIDFDKEKGEYDFLHYGEAEIGGENFRDKDLYRHPEKAGLPPELRSYHFDLTDEELRLLANAEDGDILAKELRFVMPYPLQEKILELMPDERYNDMTRAAFRMEKEEAMRAIDIFWDESSIKKAEEIREGMSTAYSIAQKIEDRGEMEWLVSMTDIKLQSQPERPKDDWAGLFGDVTEMGRDEIFTREQREQEDRDMEERRRELYARRGW